MQETWIKIDGFNRYYVSNLGRVKAVYKHRPEKIMKQQTTRKGYKCVSFSENEIKKSFFVHRLVALHFIPNVKDLPEINHKDENKSNNEINNLEWCTTDYNIDYSHAKEYVFISPEGESYHIRNLNRFCREMGLPAGNMCKLAQGIHKIIKGWTIPKSSEDTSLFPTEDAPSNSLHEI